MGFPSLKTLLFVAFVAFVAWFVFKHPGHADHVAHSLWHGLGQAADSGARFLNGL